MGSLGNIRNTTSVAFHEFPSLAPDESKLSPVGSLGNIAPMSRKDTHHVPHPKILEKAEEAFLKEGHAIERALVEKPRSAIQRFPLIFTLLGAFGLVRDVLWV